MIKVRSRLLVAAGVVGLATWVAGCAPAPLGATTPAAAVRGRVRLATPALRLLEVVRAPNTLDRLDRIEVTLDDLDDAAPAWPLGAIRPDGDGETGRVFPPITLTNLQPWHRYVVTLAAFQADPAQGGAIVRVDDNRLGGCETTFETRGAAEGSANEAVELPGGFALKLADTTFAGRADGTLEPTGGSLADAGRPEGVELPADDQPLAATRIAAWSLGDVTELRYRLFDATGGEALAGTLAGPLDAQAALALTNLGVGTTYALELEAIGPDGVTTISEAAGSRTPIDTRPDADGRVRDARAIELALAFADRPVRLMAALPIDGSVADLAEIAVALEDGGGAAVVPSAPKAVSWSAGLHAVTLTDLRPGAAYRVVATARAADGRTFGGALAFTTPALGAEADDVVALDPIVLAEEP